MIPELDYNRPTEPIPGCTRHVLDHTVVTARVDETDAWLNLPVRTVVIDAFGPAFEIGPYSVAGEDALALINALSRYGQLTGEFRHVSEPSTAPERDRPATIHPIRQDDDE